MPTRQSLGANLDPAPVIDEMSNSFHDYICDAADAMEAAMLQVPEFQDKGADIKQALDRWQLKMQRGADAQLDQFESYTRLHVFAVPPDLQLDPPGAGAASEAEEAAQLDAVS